MALLWQLGASPALAQGPLSLRDALDQGLAHTPSLRAADQQITAAQARETQAAALPNPNLSLQLEELTIANPGGAKVMAGVTQPLILGGQLAARQEVARLDRLMLEADRAILRRELGFKIKTTFFQVLRALSALELARANGASAETMRRAVQGRFRAGEVPQVEVLRAEVELSRAQRDVEVARNHLLMSSGQLNVLLGHPAQTPFTLVTLTLPATNSLPPLSELVTAALGARTELNQAETGIQREAMQRRVAQAGLWTGSEVSLSGGLAGGQPAVSTSFTMPLPFYRQQGEIAEAEANRLRAEAQRDGLRDEVTLEVEQAYRAAAIAALQAELFTTSYLPQAERLLDNAQRRFLAGEGSGLEVIEARRARHETHTEFQHVLLEFREAVAGLERAVGRDLLEWK